MVDAVKLDLAAEVLASFGHARLPVTGSSMFPCLQPGDLLHLRHADQLQSGDVAVFARHGKLVVHRVIQQSDGTVTTRGDRLRYPDEPVPAAEILGVVSAVERAGRHRSPRWTRSQRIGAAVLRRSEFGTRIALYFVRMVRT